MLTLERPHGSIAYTLDGEGPLVVLAPGMGDLRTAWRHVAPALVAAGHRVATIDLRGHGDSDVSFPSYRPDDVADDLLALVAHLGGPAMLVGHSAAAAACVKAAAEAPDRVCAIGLVGPVVRDASDPDGWMPTLVRGLFLPFWGARAWGWFYRSLFKGGWPADHDAHVARVVASVATRERRAAMLEVGLASKAACAARVADVRVPVLAVVGDRDPDYDAPAEAAWIRDVLRADVHLLPGIGHDPHQEVPDLTASLLIAFMEGLACRAA